jgi:serine/threonine protein kinase
MSYQAHFVRVRHFASGGNGDLYVGQLRNTGDMAVVKVLREFRDPHARRAFEREVQILGRNLPGVVPLLFADTRAEQPYYVMPLLSGGPLSQYVGRLDGKQAYAVAAEMARTLAHFHAAIGSHGDYKPANVLVSSTGELKVADPSGNGLGCTLFVAQNPAGTVGYWAPEVAVKGISREGDVYSFGASIYELVTGWPPRDGQQFGPTPWQQAGAPKLWEVIACCCQADPKARPTMQEVVQMLEGATWGEIQAARQRTMEVLKGIGIAAGIVLVVVGLTR